MAIGNVYYLHGAMLGSTFISQLRDAPLDWGLQDLLERPAGQPAPNFTGTHTARPSVSLQGTELKGIIDLCTQRGVAGDLSGGNCTFYCRAGDTFGFRGATASTIHPAFRMASNALLFWESIRASQGQLAEISARVVPAWDGSNAPLQFLGEIALAGTPAITALYTLGAVTINGSAVVGVQDVELASGVSLDQVMADGDAFDSYVGVDEYGPMVTFRTRDVAAADAIGYGLTVGSGLTVTFTKKTQHAFNAGSGHIVATMATGTAKVGRVAGMKSVLEIRAPIIEATPGTGAISWST